MGEFESAVHSCGSDKDLYSFLESYFQLFPAVNSGIHDAALLSCARGICYERMQNFNLASDWYLNALRYDAKCYEAFDKLVNHRLLSHLQEKEMVTHMSVSFKWLGDYYKFAVEQYECGDVNRQSTNSMFHYAPTLSENIDILTLKASYHFYRASYAEAYGIAKHCLEKDPFCISILPVLASCMVELQLKNELFSLAHSIVNAFPTLAITWYIVGCYYLCASNFDSARAFFTKSVTIDSSFGIGHIAIGHTWALQEETESSISAYRTASRILEGSHIPFLCMGMEYTRTDTSLVGIQWLSKSLEICAVDPLAYNELGVVAYKNGEYDEAIDYLLKALDLIPEGLYVAWEATLVNLATCYRKRKHYDLAIQYYEKVLQVSPFNFETFKAIGYTWHLVGNIHKAIEQYHKALSYSAKDLLTLELLQRAIEELAS